MDNGEKITADRNKATWWRAVEIPGALADPDHVRRAVVPVARQRVAPGQGLLVAQEQRLVRGPHVDLVQRRHGVVVEPAGVDEAQCPQVRLLYDVLRILLVSTEPTRQVVGGVEMAQKFLTRHR